MPSGRRPTARPGAGPGRGKPRARTSAHQSVPEKPRASPAPDAAETDTVDPGPVRRRASLTTRAIALAVVLLVLTISYASSLRIYFAQASEISATRQEIATRQRTIAELQTELGRWDDPAYVKLQARSRLGWVVPGETGYKVVGADGQPLGGGAEINPENQPAAKPKDAWWAKLWGSVAAADRPAPVAPATPVPSADQTITQRTKPKDSDPTPR